MESKQRTMRVLAVAAGWVLLASPVAWAAAPGPETGTASTAGMQLQPATRVRISVAGDYEHEGLFLSVDEDVFRILEDEDVITVTRKSIRRIEMVMPGPRPTRGKRIAIGSLIGAGAGLGSGGLAAYVLAGGVSGDPDYNAAPPIVTGVVLGALVGGVIAHATRGPGWTELPLDRLQVSVLPASQGGVRAALAIRF